MKALSALAMGILVLALPTEARAYTLLHEVTKSSPNLRVTAQRNQNGTITVTVVRDTKAARYPARSARLRVGGLEPTDLERAVAAVQGKADIPSGAGKPLVECKVEAEETADGVVYRVKLSEDAAAVAELEISEFEPDVIGGGDIYQIRLKHFLTAPAKTK